MELLNQFVEEECTKPISRMLFDEIDKARKNTIVQFLEFKFNRFNLYIYLDRNEVKIEDELDTEDTGILYVSLENLLDKISESKCGNTN